MIPVFLLYVLRFTWSESTEICCCPNLDVGISCEGTNAKMDKNGYQCNTQAGSTVTLRCNVADINHSAVRKVRYGFFKAYELHLAPLESKTQTGESQKLNCDPSASTCTIKNVRWGPKSQIKTSELNNLDGFVYQCMAEVTLIDDSSIKLPSSTIKLNILYNAKVDPTAPIEEVTKKVEQKISYVRLPCSVPETNPLTKVSWSFRQNEKDVWKKVDLTAATRMLVVGDEISDPVTFERGTLVIMFYDDSTDGGYYKCDASYNPGVPGIGGRTTTYTVSRYRLIASSSEFKGKYSLDMVSMTTSSDITYVSTDSRKYYVNFTCLARDVDLDKTPDIYEWIYEDSAKGEYLKVDVEKGKPLRGVTILDGGRTLNVLSSYSNVKQGVLCRLRRDGAVALSNDFTLPVIVPTTTKIPQTARTCVNKGDMIHIHASQRYMMQVTTTKNFVQILPGTVYRWFHGTMDFVEGFTNRQKYGGITKESELRVANNTDTHISKQRCMYFTYVRRYDNDYQLVEVLKVTKYPDSRCQKIPIETCTRATTTCRPGNSPALYLHFPTPIHQCVKAEISKNGKKLADLPLAAVNTSPTCASRNVTVRFDRAVTGEAALMGTYTVSMVPEGNTGCSLRVNIADECRKPREDVTEQTVYAVCPPGKHDINATRNCDVSASSLFTTFQLQPNVCYKTRVYNTSGVLFDQNVCATDNQVIRNLDNSQSYELDLRGDTLNCTVTIRTLCNSSRQTRPVLLHLLFLTLLLSTFHRWS